MGAGIVPGVMERQLAQLRRLLADMPVPLRIPDVPVSDHGIDGAKPLGPMEASWGYLVSDTEWSTQNRRINDVIAGRA